MWKLWSRKPSSAKSAESEVGGVSIVLLQKRYESFTTKRLTQAMMDGWRRNPDPVTFFATSVADGEGAVLKLNGMFITMLFFDHRLDASALGDLELPRWAVHGAYASITYACPGGVPAGELRDLFYGLLGLLCAELMSDNVSGLFFTEEMVLLSNQPAILQELRSGNSINPARLAARFM